jgi:endoglycosylceramidase
VDGLIRRACWLALVGVLLAGAASAPAAARPGPVLPLGHAGRWLTDASGRVVVLHGLNMMDKFPPYLPEAQGFDDADATFLAREGFNGLRLGVDYAAVEPRPGVYSSGYLNALAREVRMLARHGIVVLLSSDLNCWSDAFGGQGMPRWMAETGGLAPNPAGQGFPACYITPSAAQDRVWARFYANDPGPDGLGLESEYVRGWARIAARLKGARNVLGYDTLNEPWPGSVSFGPCLSVAGCRAFDRGALSSYTRRAAAAVHAADRDAIVWAEPNIGFDFGSPTYLGAIRGPAGFAFHDYCLAQEVDADSSQSQCPSPERRVIANALDYGRRTGAALLLSEFGGTDDLNTLRLVAGAADAAMLPWLEWTFYGKDPCCARPAEGIVRNIRRPPTGTNVKWAKLAVLVRPYPQLIAGTPVGWSWNATDRVFRLTYVTKRPGGRRLAAGLATQVFVPGLHYRRGYRVRVTGGRVTSMPDAAELTIVATGTAHRVSVLLRPR